MPVGQLVALRNLQKGVTVFSLNASNSRDFLQLEAAGDPSGGDVQYISEENATQPAVVKAILHGVVALEEDTLSDGVAGAFQQQMEAARKRQEAARQAVEQSIHRTVNVDIVGFACVGPSTTPGTPCGAKVPMKEETLKERPPLCPQHQGLAPQYVPTEDWDGQKQVTKWMRSMMSPRETMNA